MIAILGKRRLTFLLLLGVLNMIFAAAIFLYLMPQEEKQERAFRVVKNQVSTLRGDLEMSQQEFEQLETQRAFFKTMQAKGFFEEQRRRQAEEIFEQIQENSGVIAAKASIGAGKAETAEAAEKAAHAVLVSPIEITVEALDDVAVYKYIDLLEKYFPGHISLEMLRLRRAQDVSGDVLRAIAEGKRPALVNASLRLKWETMIPKSAVINKKAGGGG